MAGTINYLIPSDRMTLTDQKEARWQALIAAVNMAVLRSIATPADLAAVRDRKVPLTIDVREFQPTIDVVAALDSWLSAALVAVNTFVPIIAGVAAFVVPQQRMWVFFNVAIETIPVPVSRIQFRVGGAAGNTRAVYDLEGLAAQQTLEGYFSEPVVYAPGENSAIQLRPRIATGVGAIVRLGGFVVEIGGQVTA